jgi:hypothetical protein
LAPARCSYVASRIAARTPASRIASDVMRGSCACGANSFEVRAGAPMQRFYCHCLYCQQFMAKPATDVTFARAKNVVVHGNCGA